MNLKPTLKDVAEKAGVSVSTASRILNARGGYHPDTRARVMQAMQDLGYVVLHAPEPEPSPQRPIFGVVFPKVASMLIQEALTGLQQAAHQHGFEILVGHTDGSLERTLTVLQTFLDLPVRGVVFASEILHREYHDLLQKHQTPVVLLSAISFQFPVPFVRCDDRRAAFLATDFLIRKGHRDIAIIAGARSDPFSSTARVAGYLDALLHHHLPVQERHIVYTRGFSFQDGKDGLRLLLERETAVSAVFACSDEMAAGVLSVAAERHLSVPEQLSVMGYDNLPLCQMTHPTLTTVAQPFSEMGQQAVHLLMECLHNPNCQKGLDLGVHIIERGSVRSLP